MDFDDEFDFGRDDPTADLGFDDSDQNSRGTRFSPMHLDSPLDDSYISPLDKFYQQHPRLTHFSHTLHPQKMVAKVVRWAMGGSFKATESTVRHADEKIRLEVLQACQLFGLDFDKPLPKHSPLTLSLLGLSERLEAVSLRTCKEKQGEYQEDLQGLRLTKANGYWNCSLGGDSSILSHDLFLMMKDQILARSLVLEALEINNSFQVPLEFSSDYLVSVWSWGDSLIQELGTPAYDLIKSFESLVVGRLVSVTTRDHDVAGGDLFSDTMRQGFSSDAEERGARQASSIFLLIDQLRDPDSLNELAGLYKTWGHPCVDVPAGVKANRKVSEARKPAPDASAVEDMVLLFRKMFLGEYHRKHHKYPGCDVSKIEAGNPVRESILSNHTIPESVPLKAYSRLEFQRTFDTSSISALDIVHDKALGPTLSELKHCIATRTKTEIRDRRTLLHFLSHNYPPLADILQQLDDQGIDPEYLTLGVTPKERELKTKARLFSLIPMILKFYFGGTEKLIADHLLPYFPQITMKDDLRDLTEKVLGMTSEGSDKSVASISLHIDFEKWNMNFRDDMARPVFQEMDKLFGYRRLISMTHQVFENIQYHCHDGKHWPTLGADGEIVQNELAWKGQFGGVEGLRQKGWTILTILIITLATEGSFARFNLTGQGDNQVLCAKYDLPRAGGLESQTEEMLSWVRTDFRAWEARLYSIAQKVGMPIKPSESWSSSTLYSYGKNTYLRGRPLEAKLKRLSRCFPTTNDLHPSLYSSLVAIGANAQSAAYQSSSPLVAYIVGTRQFEVSLRAHLAFHPGVETGVLAAPGGRFLGKKVPELGSDDAIRGLLYGAAVVGGYPVVHLYSFFSLGGPDHLSEYLSWMMDLGDRCPEPLRQVLRAWCSPLTSPKEPDFRMLFQDPSSGNFLSGTIASNLVKRVVKDWFKSGVVQNKVVLSLLQVQEVEDAHLVQALSCMTPLNPVLASYLCSVTPSEFAREFVGRFDNASSVRVLAVGTALDFTGRMSKLESDFYGAAVIQMTEPRNEILNSCPTQRAQELRILSWGRPDIVGVTTPALWSLLSRSQGDKPDLILSMDETRSGQLLRTTGHRPPYLGSRGERVVQQHNDYTSVDPEKIMKRLIRARSVLGAILEPDDPILNWVGRLWTSVTDFDYRLMSESRPTQRQSQLSLLRQLLTTGGSIAHHFTVSTHTWVMIPEGSALSKGTMLSKNVHFPTVLLSINSIVSILASLGLETPQRSEWCVVCPGCVIGPPPEPIGPRSMISVPTPSMEGSEGVWVSMGKIERTLVRSNISVAKLQTHVPSSREEIVSWVGWSLSGILTGQRADHSPGDLTWISRGELYDSVLSWYGARLFRSSTLVGRQQWYCHRDWEDDLKRQVKRIKQSNLLALATVLQEAGAFWDSPGSVNCLVTDPTHLSGVADQLRLNLGKANLIIHSLVDQGSWKDLVQSYLSFHSWNLRGYSRVETLSVLERVQEIEKYCALERVPFSPLLIKTVSSSVAVNLRPKVQVVLEAIVGWSYISREPPFVTRQLAKREVVFVEQGELCAPYRWMNDVDVDSHPQLGRLKPENLVDAQSVDYTLISNVDCSSELRKILQTVQLFMGTGPVQIIGWGLVKIAHDLWASGVNIHSVQDGWTRGGLTGPYPSGALENIDLPWQTPGCCGLVILPRSWGPSYALHVIEHVVGALSGSAALLLPWGLCRQTGLILLIIRRRFPRFRVLSGASGEIVSRFVVLVEGAPNQAAPIVDTIFTPRLYPQWESALRSGGQMDPCRRSGLGAGELDSYVGSCSPAGPGELWVRFQLNALDGVDLASHFPEARRKRYKGSSLIPLDLRDLSIATLAIADACGLSLSERSYLSITFSGGLARLEIEDHPTRASYPIHRALRSEPRYQRLKTEALQVLRVQDDEDSRDYTPSSPAYAPTDDSFIYESDEWDGQGASYGD